jgi:hypothetical protein
MRHILLLLILASLVGCVERTISIGSDPTGALVYLNDEEVGRTPLTVPFTFYGIYDVRLEADGYEPLWTTQKAVSPWWETIGPDLFAELVPHARVDLTWHFNMQPTAVPSDVDVDLLLNRAQQMRIRTDNE